ncbi:MAG: hypothetical protein V7629_11640 [Motiliproteus sp.]
MSYLSVAAVMRCAVIVLFSLAVAGCGGGEAAPAKLVGQAVLGPLAGAEIRAYLLTDLTTPIAGPITANGSLTDPDQAGRFELTLAAVSAETWVLFTATGGQDIDADDDGELDPTPTPSNGVVHALATAEQ